MLRIFRPPLFAAIAGLVACQPPPLDTTRKTAERGTLGEEVFALFLADYERDDPERAEGFRASEARFVEAVDHLFPPSELRKAQNYLVQLLPLYDDGTLPKVTRRLAEVLGRLKDDPEATAALAAVLNRSGYVELDRESPIARRMAAFPDFSPLTRRFIDLALAHDGLDDAGELDASESAAIGRFVDVLAARLETSELSTDDARDIVLMANLFLTEDDRVPEGAPMKASIVARDLRGMAAVASYNRALPRPFADREGDGMADVDRDGRFLGGGGEILDLPPFGDGGARDDRRRLLVAPGGPRVFDYVELDRTLLTGLVRDGRDLVHASFVDKSLNVAKTLLGERLPTGRYSARDNALVDLGYAAATVIDGDEIPDLIELLRRLLSDHEATLGFVLLELEHQTEIADRSSAALAPGNTFEDDLLATLRKILAVPGLTEDLVSAIEDPAFAGFTAAGIQMSRYKKDLITEADYDAGPGAIFSTPVDFGAPDVRTNRSLLQRVLHLMYDTHEARYEPKFVGIPLGFIFEIDDLAEFYVLSLIGESSVPSLVSTLTGLPERPTAIDLARFINHEQDFGNPKGNDGLDVKDNHGDALFAVSASGMGDALAPLVRAFHKHGRMDLFFEIFEVLHLHFPTEASGEFQSRSRGAPSYAKLSGLRRYEPMLLEIQEDTKIIDAVRKLLAETKTLKTEGGTSAKTLLVDLLRRFLAKDERLTTRTGRRDVTIDGKRISPLAPLDLVRDATDRLDAKVKSKVSSYRDYETVKELLSDKFGEVERTGPTAGRLANRRAIPILLHGLDLMERRARVHERSGTLDGWVQDLLVTKTSEAIESDLLPAALDALDAIDAEATLAELVEVLRDELLAEEDGLPDLLVGLGDVLSAAKDAQLAVPVLRFMGKELKADPRLRFDTLDFARRALVLDPDEHTLELGRRAIETRPGGGMFALGLGEAIARTNRLDPGSDEPLSGQDVAAILGRVADYLTDEEHGMEKFYELVSRRNGPAPMEAP